MLKQWHNFYGKLRQHEGFHFAFDSLVVFAGTGVISVLFVLFHAVVSRLMGTAEYAQFVALIALLNVLNVPSLVVSTTMARYVAEFVTAQRRVPWASSGAATPVQSRPGTAQRRATTASLTAPARPRSGGTW